MTPKTAAEHDRWYVRLMKAGMIFACANFHEWVHYNPRRAWLDSLHE